MKHASILSLALMLSTSAAQAWAADVQDLDKVSVEMWPEYDRPAAVLVLYEVTLPVTTVLPTVVRLPVPKAVAAPHAVAKHGPDGGLYHTDFTREESGEFAVFAIQTDSLGVRLEYYQAIDTSKDARSFEFKWPGLSKVQTFEYIAQVPKEATDYSVVPASSKQAPGSNGLMHHYGTLGALDAGQAASIVLNYKRSILEPSMGTAPPPAAAPAAMGQAPLFPPAAPSTPPPASPAPASNSNQPTWFIVIVIGILVLAVGFWVGRSSGGEEA